MCSRKGVGICLLVSGVIMLFLAFLFWTIINAVVLSTLKSMNFITSRESDLFPDWECSWRPGEEPMNAYEVFYVFNMTNPDEVIAGGVPIYDERGPFVYLANYTKFHIEFLENDLVQYKRCKTFFQDMDRSSGPDSEVVVNINPGYLGAVYATGGETVLILIMTGPAVDLMLDDIEVKYINATLLPDGGFDLWLERCIAIDPDCRTTRDMAIVQWGHYVSRTSFGINNEEMNDILPIDFPSPQAEYGVFCAQTITIEPGNEMTIARTKKLLYGDMGIVNDPANFEYLALSIGNETALVTWGLEDGRAVPFMRYTLNIADSYSVAFLQGVIAQGSGFLRWRTVWEILWEDIDPLLMVLQPWAPYVNIFFNYTTQEVADQLTGYWRINNGDSDTQLVEEMFMWENYEEVDVFWTNHTQKVSGNSGNGQFIPGPLSFSGKPVEVFPEFWAWSSDHGRPVLFKDSGKKVDFFNVTTHLLVMVNETYDPDPLYDIYDPFFYGFVNATRINDDVPIYYSQPRMLLVDQYWRDWAKGIREPDDNVDNTYIWIEPITGLALSAEVKLQVNFFVPNKTEMPLFDRIYTQVPDKVMYPLTWTQQEAILKEQDAVDLEEQLFSLLDTCDILWIILWVFGCVFIAGGAVLVYTAPKEGYQTIN